MSGVLSLAALTTAWGVVMAVSPALQIRRIRETRSSLGVSTAQVAVIFVGNGLWPAYGISSNVAPLIIVNVIAPLGNRRWLIHVVRYRPSPDTEAAEVAAPAGDEPPRTGRPRRGRATACGSARRNGTGAPTRVFAVRVRAAAWATTLKPEARP